MAVLLGCGFEDNTCNFLDNRFLSIFESVTFKSVYFSILLSFNITVVLFLHQLYYIIFIIINLFIYM